MSRKSNKTKGGKKVRNYGSLKGGGMSKHGKSGVPHNHANTIARVREEAERLEKEANLREMRRQKWLMESKNLGDNSSR